MDWNRLGPPVDLRPLFPVERAGLVELLCVLGPADWRRPTVCPGWSVHDLVGHLLNDYVRRLSITRDEYELPPWRQGEDLATMLTRVNQEFVVASRCASPRLMIELITFLGPRLDAMWVGTDLNAPASIDVSWAAPGVPAPGWLDVAREYTELWVHQQQIRDAVGRPGGTRPELMRPVIDVFLRALPYTLRNTIAPVGAQVRVRVPGAAGGEWTVARQDEGWALVAESAAEATTLVEIDADDLWRLASRGITPREARMKVRMAGNRALAEATLTLLAIVR